MGDNVHEPPMKNQCPYCGEVVEIDSHLRGKLVTCSNQECGQVFRGSVPQGRSTQQDDAAGHISRGQLAESGPGTRYSDELQWEVTSPAMASGAARGKAWQWVTSISWDIFIVVACVLSSIYWSVERPRLLEAAGSLLPSDRREEANGFFREAEQKLGAFARGQALLCLLVGLMAWAARWPGGLSWHS